MARTEVSPKVEIESKQERPVRPLWFSIPLVVALAFWWFGIALEIVFSILWPALATDVPGAGAPTIMDARFGSPYPVDSAESALLNIGFWLAIMAAAAYVIPLWSRTIFGREGRQLDPWMIVLSLVLYAIWRNFYHQPHVAVEVFVLIGLTSILCWISYTMKSRTSPAPVGDATETKKSAKFSLTERFVLTAAALVSLAMLMGSTSFVGQRTLQVSSASGGHGDGSNQVMIAGKPFAAMDAVYRVGNRGKSDIAITKITPIGLSDQLVFAGYNSKIELEGGSDRYRVSRDGAIIPADTDYPSTQSLWVFFGVKNCNLAHRNRKVVRVDRAVKQLNVDYKTNGQNARMVIPGSSIVSRSDINMCAGVCQEDECRAPTGSQTS